MTKLMRNLLLAILIVCLSGLPLAAAAQSLQKTVSARDFEISYADKSYKFGLGASVNANADLENGNLSLRYQLTGDGEIGECQVAFKDGALKLWADGLSSAYAITADDLMALLKQSGAPFDMEAYLGVMTAYMRLLQDASDPDVMARVNGDMDAWLNSRFEDIATVYPDLEAVRLGGADRVMQRARLTITAELFDELMDVMSASLPSFGEFMDQYIAFFGSVDPDMAARLPAARPYTYRDMRRLANLEMLAIVDIWAEEAGALRMSMNYVFALDQGGEVELFHMPLMMDVYQDGDARVREMTMSTDIEGAKVAMTFNAREQSSGDAAEQAFSMEMKVDSPYEAVATVRMDGAYSAPGDGTERANGSLTVADSQSGEAVRCTLDYDGTLAVSETATKREGRVVLGLEAPMAFGADIGRGEFAFTLAVETSPYDEAATDALDALPVISILELTNEQMATLEREFKIIAIRAVGALLITPGVAELFSEQLTQMGGSFDFGL